MKEYVAVYILNSDKTKVFYCLKDKPSKPYLHGKTVGWGGRIEEYDKDIYEAAIRELKEELDLDLKKEDLTYRGIIYDEVGKAYIFTLLNNTLQNHFVEGEGQGTWRDIDYHKTNPELFLDFDLEFLDILYKSDEIFERREI